MFRMITLEGVVLRTEGDCFSYFGLTNCVVLVFLLHRTGTDSCAFFVYFLSLFVLFGVKRNFSFSSNVLVLDE